MKDLTVEYGRIREESRLDRTGAETLFVIVPFYVGTHGPFTERMTQAEYRDGVTLRSRVEAIKATLQNLPG
jgi:hypothetical protein